MGVLTTWMGPVRGSIGSPFSVDATHQPRAHRIQTRAFPGKESVNRIRVKESDDTIRVKESDDTIRV